MEEEALAAIEATRAAEAEAERRAALEARERRQREAREAAERAAAEEAERSAREAAEAEQLAQQARDAEEQDSAADTGVFQHLVMLKNHVNPAVYAGVFASGSSLSFPHNGQTITVAGNDRTEGFERAGSLLIVSVAFWFLFSGRPLARGSDVSAQTPHPRSRA
eukprot:COSAG02_NODE_12852_length_1482_cov_2.112798_2_plen_164_part_00